jgi:hypothetical protein
MIIRRVGVWSIARLYGAMMAVAGLLGGTLIALMAAMGGLAGLMGSSDTKAGLAAGGLGAIFGVGAIVIMPICYGVFGLILGSIGAALYNLFAGFFGGIEVDVQP